MIKGLLERAIKIAKEEKAEVIFNSAQNYIVLDDLKTFNMINNSIEILGETEIGSMTSIDYGFRKVDKAITTWESLVVIFLSDMRDLVFLETCGGRYE